MDSSSIYRKRAIDELARGCKIANKLQKLLLINCQDDKEWVIAEDLVREVLNSFTNTVSILNPGQAHDEVSHIQGLSCSSILQAPKSESSDEISNSSPQKDRRGHYKRRKIRNTQHVDSTSLLDDGHAWRKYGQKAIHDANYPRSYYRCTHKNEGCEATKQVQRIRGHPPLDRATYFGHHTCKNLQLHHIFVDDPTGEYDNAKLLSFGANNSKEQTNSPLFSSFLSLKQENSDEPPSEGSQNQPSNSANYPLSSDLPAFDHGNEDCGMISSPTSSYSLSMNPMVDSNELDFWGPVPSSPGFEDLW